MPYTTQPMSQLTHKSHITSPNNLTYSYYLSPNFSASRTTTAPTLLFLHGYPDDAYMWAGAIPTFLDLPYRFIVLNLLGFGDSSKPTETKLYNYKKQADAIRQILEHEGVAEENSVVPIGHDWGSALAQRFYLYNRRLCTGLILLSLAYQIPSSEPFHLPTANTVTWKRFGYPQWEYWNFFLSPSAPGLMRENMKRFFEVNHGFLPGPNGEDIWMREMFCVPGAMEEYVAQSGRWKDRTVELKSYAAKDSSIFERFKERMSRDGFEGPVQYYHSLAENTMLEDERALCLNEQDKRIDVPMLYIGQTGDWVCRTDLMADAVEAGLVRKEDLEEKVVEAGHWVLYEKPEEIAEMIKEWLGRKFPVRT